METRISLEHMLGGKATFRMTPKTPGDWHALLETGLPMRALESFKQATALSDVQLASLVGISGKTLQRARSTRKRLDAVTSDRLFRTARLVTLAGTVLESGERGIAWLGRVQTGLGGKVPLALMTTEAGCDQVEKLLLRIEHGVYS
jgi:putative toxin-antitoxin system antitoxin component (TIGR02293 family)